MRRPALSLSRTTRPRHCLDMLPPDQSPSGAQLVSSEGRSDCPASKDGAFRASAGTSSYARERHRLRVSHSIRRVRGKMEYEAVAFICSWMALGVRRLRSGHRPVLRRPAPGITPRPAHAFHYPNPSTPMSPASLPDPKSIEGVTFTPGPLPISRHRHAELTRRLEQMQAWHTAAAAALSRFGSLLHRMDKHLRSLAPTPY